jgi:hypothetical protein
MFIALDVLNQLRSSFRSETFTVSSQSHFAHKESMEILKSTRSYKHSTPTEPTPHAFRSFAVRRPSRDAPQSYTQKK